MSGTIKVPQISQPKEFHQLLRPIKLIKAHSGATLTDANCP